MSIVEALIACVLISGISIALFGVWAMHAKATAHTRDMLVAESWARQLMEEQLSKGYETVGSEPAAPFVIKHIEADVVHYREYYYATYITDTATPINPGLKRVVVQVQWEEQNIWKHFRLVTDLSWQG